jgi:hypothetical protein
MVLSAFGAWEELRSMSLIRKAGLGVAALALGIFASTAASAQDYRSGEFREFKGPHSFGAHCHYRVAASGEGFGGVWSGREGIRKAELRAVRHWEERVAAHFGPRVASWPRSAGKELRCDRRGPNIACTASAHPCGEGRYNAERDWRGPGGLSR